MFSEEGLPRVGPCKVHRRLADRGEAGGREELVLNQDGFFTRQRRVDFFIF